MTARPELAYRRPRRLAAVLALGACVVLAGCDAIAAIDPPGPRPADIDLRKVVGEGSTPVYTAEVSAVAGDAVQVRVESTEGDTLRVQVADGPRARAEISASINGGAPSAVAVRAGGRTPIELGRPIELTPGDLEVIPTAVPGSRRYELTVPQVYGQEKGKGPVTFKLKVR